MNFLIGFLGAIIGLLFTIVIVVVLVMSKVKKTVGASNLNLLYNAAKQAKNLEISEYSRPKNVSGMTKILEPTILKDFPEFNKNLLYTKVEENLSKIFNALENRCINSIKNDENLIFIIPIIEDKIKDLESMNMKVKYDAVKFHRHAIKKYEKSSGIATVEISSTVEYYYTEKSQEKKKISKSINNVKKQTRYTTKFVYVYDESKFDENQLVFGISCPNCGAPLKRLDIGDCEYCSTHLEPINLKIWKMSSYKEDYN